MIARQREKEWLKLIKIELKTREKGKIKRRAIITPIKRTIMEKK